VLARDNPPVLSGRSSIMAPRVVTDENERRPLIEAAVRRWRRTDIEDLMRDSPLILLTVGDAS
jgi:hypothetical protein